MNCIFKLSAVTGRCCGCDLAIRKCFVRILMPLFQIIDLKNTELWVEYSLTILCPEQQAFVFLCNITTSSLQLIFAKNSMFFSHYNTVLYWETFLLQDWCLLFIKTNFSSFVLRCWSLLHFSFLEMRWERTAQLGLFLLDSSDVCVAVGVLPGI